MLQKATPRFGKELRSSCVTNIHTIQADAHDARPALPKSIPTAFKHNPPDSHDARPAGSLNPSIHSVELLRLLWVQRPGDRRENFKHNPADAHDARPALPKSIQSPDRTATPAVGSRARAIGERVSSTIQLMLMMLALRSLNPSNHPIELLRLLWVQGPGRSEREFQAQSS